MWRSRSKGRPRMKRSSRRYEILLPLQFNDGRPVPAAVNRRTLDELRKRFGGVSAETQKIQGEWAFGGKVFRDRSAPLRRRARHAGQSSILHSLQEGAQAALSATRYLDNKLSCRSDLT